METYQVCTKKDEIIAQRYLPGKQKLKTIMKNKKKIIKVEATDSLADRKAHAALQPCK